MTHRWTLNNEEQIQAFIEYARIKGKLTVEILDNPATQTQLNSLNMWCSQVAELFQASGMDMKQILKPTAKITPTGTLVKEYIIKPVAKAMFDKLSTKDLSTKEVGEVVDEINMRFAKKGIVLPEFPKRG